MLHEKMNENLQVQSIHFNFTITGSSMRCLARSDEYGLTNVASRNLTIMGAQSSDEALPAFLVSRQNRDIPNRDGKKRDSQNQDS